MATEGYDYTRGRTRTPRSAPLTARQARDLLALVLILAGLAGVLTVVFLASPLAGWGVVAATALSVGVLLGVDRR